MEDLIRREDAIDAINLRARIPHDIASAQYASMAINAIRTVPSADRPQEWIPCSERLPEENGEYLITLAFAWGREIEVGLWSDGEWLNDNSHVNIAWMPLPKPWKGAKDE